VTTKDNYVKNVPKRHVQVQDRSKIVVDEDLIILDLIECKEVTPNVLVVDVINLVEELYSSPSVGAV